MKWVGLGAILVALAAIAAVVAFNLEETGESVIEEVPERVQALLRVHRQPLTTMESVRPTDFNPEEFQVYKDTQSALMRSRHVLVPALEFRDTGEIVRRYESDQPVAWLAEHLEITFPEDGELMQVEIVGGDSEEMKAVLDSVVHSYIEIVVGQEEMHSMDTLALLRKNYRHLRDELRETHDELKDIQSTADGDADTAGTIETLRLLEFERLKEYSDEVGRRADRLALEMQGPQRVEILRYAAVVD